MVVVGVSSGNPQATLNLYQMISNTSIIGHSFYQDMPFNRKLYHTHLARIISWVSEGKVTSRTWHTHHLADH